MTDIPILQHYIDGGYVGSRSESLFETVNPATGEVLAKVDEAHAVDVDVAVAAAKAGFEVWRKMRGAERGRILVATANMLRERNEELALLEVQDTGKPIAEARAVDVFSAADCLEYFGGLAASLHGEHFDLGSSAFAYTRREPLGVCLGIGAWNYPIQIAAWKSAPALAAGNAMIFKPSEMTPLTAAKLAEIFTECGLPKGVFNVVQGKGDTGRALVAHPGIRKVSLTGSVPTGRKVMEAAAATMKHVTMELGGKSPLIIFEDSHLDNAVSAAMMANFYTQGEICSNGTRVFVERSLMDTFVEKTKARAEAMTIGDPMADDTDMGSLISPEHMDKVMSYIARGLEEGADLVTGGERVVDGDLSKGSFMRPTIFTGCRDRMAIVREEIFGPVMCVLPFDSEEEVVRRANDSEFGLAAGVFTKDIQRAHRVVAQLEAGTCWINNYNITPIEMPFGGAKQSGLGRENSLAALNHYTELKSVYVELGDVEAPY